MKMFRVVCLAAAIVMPSLAMAELPFSKQGLGQVEATIDYCSKVNPQEAQKFKDYGKRLIKGFPGAEVEEARKSEEYQKTYKSMTEELGKVSKDEAVKACSGLLEEKK